MTETTYSVGTASVANGGTAITGVGTAWAGKVFKGDLFTDPAQGLFARITADATSDTSLSCNAWPGTTLAGAAYEILYTADSVRMSERTRQLLEQMSVIEASGRGLFYLFSDGTADADPGAGYFRFNHATIASATAAYPDNLDAEGATVSSILDTWDDGTSTIKGQLWVRSLATPTTFHAFSVSGSVVDGTGYRKLTLAYVGGSGALAADDEIMVLFVPTGDKGDTGAAGVTMTYSSTTTAADPGAGTFRLNHATHASATAAYIDNVEALAGADITSLLDSWDDSTATIKGSLKISSKADPAIFRDYNITGSVVDSTGYRTVTVAYVTGAGTLADGTSCTLAFSRTGDDGANGANGTNGTNGADGYSPGYRLTFDGASTADSDPGAGKVRFNHATFASITYLYVDNEDASANSLTAWLDGLDDVVNANARAYVRLQKATDPTVYAEFAVVGTVVDGTGYRKVPVSPVAGAVPADATALVATASKSGADGAGTGDFVGPASSATGNLVTFGSTSGKLGADSGVAISSVTAFMDNSMALDALFALEIADLKGDRMSMVGGIGDPFDDETDVDTATSTNEVYSSASDLYSPATSTETSSATNGTGSGAGYTMLTREWALNNSETVTAIGISSTVSGTYVLKIAKRNSAGNYDIVVSQSVSHGGTGWEDFTLSSPYAVPASGDYYAGFYATVTASCRTLTARSFKLGDITGTGQTGFTENSDNCPSVRAIYSASNMTLVSNAFTATAVPTTARLALFVDPQEAMTINTDLTGEVSRDGGTTWTAATLALVSNPVGTVEQYEDSSIDISGQPSGSSMKWRVKTLNNKDIDVTGVVFQWS